MIVADGVTKRGRIVPVLGVVAGAYGLIFMAIQFVLTTSSPYGAWEPWPYGIPFLLLGFLSGALAILGGVAAPAGGLAPKIMLPVAAALGFLPMRLVWLPAAVLLLFATGLIIARPGPRHSGGSSGP